MIKFIFVSIFMFCGFVSFASNSHLKGRTNIKLHYSQSTYHFGQDFIIEHFGLNKATPRYSVEANYGFFNFIDAGLYMGFSTYRKIEIDKDFWDSNPNDNDGDAIILQSKLKPILFYGINVNIYLLPLLIKRDNFWLDVYFLSKLGLISYIGVPFPDKGYAKQLEYGVYGGIAIYPGKHWGLFYEHGTGSYIDKRFGLSLKF